MPSVQWMCTASHCHTLANTSLSLYAQVNQHQFCCLITLVRFYAKHKSYITILLIWSGNCGRAEKHCYVIVLHIIKVFDSGMLGLTMEQTLWLYNQSPFTRSITLWHHPDDQITANYLAGVRLLRGNLPKHRVLYDLPSSVIAQLKWYAQFIRSILLPELQCHAPLLQCARNSL